MKIFHIDSVTKDIVNTPLFTGTIARQSPLAGTEESDLSIDYIHFPKGIRNKFHTHSHDQVLIITKGEGAIAIHDKTYSVKVGDVVWIPAGEIHWHGANSDSDFTHISVTHSKTKLTQVEQ